VRITITRVTAARPHWGAVWNDYFRNDPKYRRSRIGVALYLGKRGLSLTWREPRITLRADGGE